MQQQNELWETGIKVIRNVYCIFKKKTQITMYSSCKVRVEWINTIWPNYLRLEPATHLNPLLIKDLHLFNKKPLTLSNGYGVYSLESHWELQNKVFSSFYKHIDANYSVHKYLI